MNHKRSHNSNLSSQQTEKDTVAQEKNQVESIKLCSGDRVIEQSSNLHQVNLLQQSLWLWWRHLSQSYFNQGLFWGGLVSMTSILSAIGGVALTKIDLVNREISQVLPQNFSISASVEDSRLNTPLPLNTNLPRGKITSEPEPNRLSDNSLPKSTPKLALQNSQATSTIKTPQPLSSQQSSVLARKNSVQNNLIEVQNTTNNPELGRQVVAYLRQQNFRHVYLVQHIPLKLKQTKIVSNYGQVETADYLKNILGFGNLEAQSTLQQPKLLLQLGEDALFQINYRFYR
ncbi:hypothetical protein C7B62_02925 [Pleurocapsa sp. CCALA 161]|uniref:LytR C-terminal domain-containing protein n=1 Tax=Pleurocapsa sp. CCALA 161 TaxID=2107688 RepID=UPI000D04DFC6|nr:LytR C-terminal domain-containing protein [Pleurocapsa sp. CCALA 161]PSB12208.1 hypothetical protein C7B62_02925 [Pleurocapsa sp. CCALA 161]